jgi:2',3'-cyclic-nucleotide 2'-phosphodiesterase (5'-nucleotidase family)
MRKCVLPICIFLMFASCAALRINQVDLPQLARVDSLAASNDTTLIQMLQPYRDSMNIRMSIVIGQSSQPMTKALPEGLLGNYCAEACMRQVTDWCRQNQTPKPDFCILNHGGLRASLPFGDITLGNVYELMPFDNELVIIRISQDDLKALAKHTASKGGAPVVGLRMRIHEGEADSIEIISNRNSGKTTFTMLTSDYLANGGDGFPIRGTSANQTATGLKVRDVLISDVHEHKLKNDSIRSGIDGRIR